MNNNIIFFFILIITCVYSQDYFQDCTGNSIDCTDSRIHCVGANWYNTIQSAIDDFNSAYCDTEFDCVVLIEDGIYNENIIIGDINITLASNFICDNDITHRDSTIINGSVLDEIPPIPPYISSGILIYSSNDIPITPSIIGLTIKDGLGTLLDFIDNSDIDEDILLVGGGVTMINSFPTIRFNKFLSNGFRSGGDNIIEESSYGGALSGFIGSGIGVGREIILDQDIDNIIVNRPDEIFFSNNIFNGNYSDIGKSVYLFGYGNNINMENSSFDVIYEGELGFIDVSEYWIMVGDTTSLSFENCDGDEIAISDDIWVDKESNIPGDGDGSINNPFKTITRALETIYVPANEEQKNIYISNSEYVYDTDNDIFPLHLIDKVALIGEMDQREPTILNANNKANTIIIENSQQVSIENINIKNGKKDGYGGAIVCKNSQLNISFVEIDSSEAEKGGGLYALNSEITMSNILINNNNVTYNGGGILLDSSSAIINNIEIIRNNAEYGGGIYLENNSNLTVNIGYINGNPSDKGGGAYVSNSNVSFQNVQISSNISTNGGGLYIQDNSVLMMVGCNLNENISEEGGGIFVEESLIELYNCEFNNNEAEDNGGSMFLKEIDNGCSINNCEFNNNEAEDKGGSIYIIESNLLVDNCKFLTSESNDIGGAIYMKWSNPIISNSEFTNCESENEGGALYINGSSPLFNNVDLINNEADDNLGGAIFITGSNSNISNPVFYRVNILGNDADKGGGIYIKNHSNALLGNSNFVGNRSDGFDDDNGDGIFIENNDNSVYFINTIFYDNNGLNNPDDIYLEDNALVYIVNCNLINGLNQISGDIENLVYDLYSEFDIVIGDPEFVDYFGDDFYLNDQSPCIDAGIDSVIIDDELIFSISQEDFHGNAPDIGFMEYELIILLGDVNLDGSINVQDIVTMVAIILDTILPVDDQIIASDINVDGIVDILDVILLVSIILD